MTLPSTNLIPSGTHPPAAPSSGFTRDQIDLIKRTIARDLTDDEFALFMAVARNSGLDPFLRQIQPMKRGGKLNPYIGVDGCRVIGARPSARPATPPRITFLVDPNDPRRPTMATATGDVFIEGRWVPLVRDARWDEFKPPAGQDVMYQKMPFHMLGKDAEVLYWRAACPVETSGLVHPAEVEDGGEVARPRRAVRAYAAAGERPGAAEERGLGESHSPSASAPLERGGSVREDASSATGHLPAGGSTHQAEAAPDTAFKDVRVPGVALAIDAVQHARNLLHDQVNDLLAHGVTRQSIGAAKMRAAAALKVAGASKMTIDEMPVVLLDAFYEQLQKIERPAAEAGEAGGDGEA